MSCLLCDLGALHVQYSMSVCLDVRTYVRCGLLPVPMPLPVPVLVPATRYILVLSSLVLCLCCLLSLICECHVMCLQLQALANSTARHSPTATRQIATLTAIPCSAAVPVQYNSVHNRMSSPRIGLTPQQATILVCSIHTYANERMLESKARVEQCCDHPDPLIRRWLRFLSERQCHCSRVLRSAPYGRVVSCATPAAAAAETRRDERVASGPDASSC